MSFADTSASGPDVPDAAADGAARDEAFSLACNWLLADPELPFSRARKDAAKLQLPLTARLYAEARRSLGITGGPPRPAAKRPVAESPRMTDQGKPKTPLMAFVTDYLRSHPTAEYSALKEAAAQKGFKIAPIVYGRARKELGLAGAGPKRPGPATKKSADKKPSAAAAPAPRRSAASAGNGGGDLGAMLSRLQTMAAERDRFHAALSEIADIVRGLV